MNNYSVYTDLALEARELHTEQGHQEPEGVVVEEKEYRNAFVTRVELTTEEAAKTLNKQIGTYITIDCPQIRDNSKIIQVEISEIIAKEIKNLIPINDNATGLIVGLGNWNSTPDSLGPMVAKHVLVTRHLHDHVPKELIEGLRPTCAIAPGVLGITGMETGEIIRGIVDRIKPDFVVAVDALAARNLERVGTTVQIADTGIHPGSGMGSKRIGLTKETLGIPVIALGIPTVVYASTIAHDLIEELLKEIQQLNHTQKIFVELEENKVIESVLSPFQNNLMVTPKEIDSLINDMSKIIAGGLNAAFHPKIDLDDVMRYLH